jgi:hypothetical protein
VATYSEIDRALQQFALSSQPKTRTGQISRFLPRILALRQQGFRFNDIAKLLTEHGICVTGKQLSEAVRQVQKTRNSKPATVKLGVSMPVPAPAPAPPRRFVHDPLAPIKDLIGE